MGHNSTYYLLGHGPYLVYDRIIGCHELMKQKLLNNSNNEKPKTIDKTNESKGM
jgi:hypothetical protein